MKRPWVHMRTVSVKTGFMDYDNCEQIHIGAWIHISRMNNYMYTNTYRSLNTCIEDE